MYKGYDISEDFKEFCCEDSCNPESPLMLNILKQGLEMWNSLKSDDEIKVTEVNIECRDGESIIAKIFEPYGLEGESPCLIYYHGGGFLAEPGEYQIRNAKLYAINAKCKVIMPAYRLMPKYVYPVAVNDSYDSLLWTVRNSERFGIDKNRIAIGGDSAGGTLTAVVAQMARDMKGPKICFQMMTYPCVDFRMETESMKKFTDTPIWNSVLNKFMWDMYLKNGYDKENMGYVAPILADSFENLPPAYIETVEFDCLRDEGKAYAHALKEVNVPTQLEETKRTIHSFDVVEDSEIYQRYLKLRIQALKKAFK